MRDKIAQLTRLKALPFRELCTRLNCSEKQLLKEIEDARGAGYTFRVYDQHVSTVPSGTYPTVRKGAAKPGRHKVALVTDIHFGSRFCDTAGLVDFLQRAKRDGVTQVVCTGDILDGNKPVLLPEQDHIGFDHQVDLAVTTVAKVKGLSWTAIDGNHDGYFSASSGLVSGVILRDRMRRAGVDWDFAGICEGRAVIHGATWNLWHPHGGASTRNAIRRILNARIENMKDTCNILAMGHFHKFVGLPVFPERVFGVAGGTWQRKGSEFANRISAGWEIGGTIVSYDVAKSGAVSNIAAEFVDYT